MRSALFILIFSLFIISNGKAQIAKDKKATYRYSEFYIERENAETFDYKDNDIEFTIEISSRNWLITIENKTKQNMNIYWGKGTFVINKISSSILFATTRTLEPYAPPYIEKIAPESMTREKYINPSELTYIIDDQILKKAVLITSLF